MSDEREDSGEGSLGLRDGDKSLRARNGRVVAVTGAASFLGRNLIGLLEEDPRVSKVIALDVTRPRTAGKKTRCYDVDFTQPSAEARVAEVLSAERATELAHLAFLASPTHATAWAHELESVGTMHVMVAARHAGIRRVVMASSTLVYGAHGSNPNYLTESHTARPTAREPFLTDKLEAESEVLRAAGKSPDMSAAILRFAPILGPTVRSYLTTYLSRRFVPTMMGFDPLLQFLHEVDAVSALKYALERNTSGLFNVVGEGVLPLSTTIKLAGRIGVSIPHPIAETTTAGAWLLQICEAPPTFLAYLRFLCVADGEKAKQTLGFRPTYSTREALLDFTSAQRLRDVKLLEEGEA